MIDNRISDYHRQKMKYYEDQMELRIREVAAARTIVVVCVVILAILIASSFWG